MGRGRPPPPRPPRARPAALPHLRVPAAALSAKGTRGGRLLFPLFPRTPPSIPWENANQEKNETRFSRSRRGLFTRRHGAGASGGSHGKGQAGRGQSRPFWALLAERPRGRRTGTEEGEWVRKPSRSGRLSRPRGAASAFAGHSRLAGSRGQYFGALRAADRPRGHRSPESHRHSHVRACGQGTASHSSQKPPAPEDT